MKISKSLPIALLAAIMLGLQASGYAQGNLVNLYDWTGETLYGSDANEGIFITSFNSAIFFGAYASSMQGGPDHIVPILAGNLATTPGATYEISYTLAYDASFTYCDGSLLFGSFGYEIDLPFTNDLSLPPGSLTSENFDFFVAATSPATTASFVWSAIDNGDEVVLSNFSVMEVPEASTSGLFGLGGCVWLAAWQGRRWLQKRKRS